VAQQAQVDEGNAFGESSARLAVNGERGLQVGAGLFHPALIGTQAAQVAVHVAFEAPGSNFTVDGERLLIVSACLLDAAQGEHGTAFLAPVGDG
jgi:hypothetical protein